ncbi:virginiamycin B lyase, partial [Streptomyces sp. NPDC059524]
MHCGGIARLTESGGIERHALDSESCGPSVITAGPDGALWFTRARDGRVGRITVDGRSTAYASGSPDSGPFGIAAGADGALWFTEM